MQVQVVPRGVRSGRNFLKGDRIMMPIIVKMKMERHTYAEIASNIGVSRKTVKKHYRRWRKDHSYTC